MNNMIHKRLGIKILYIFPLLNIWNTLENQMVSHQALSKLTADVLYHHLHWTMVQNRRSSASGRVLNSSETKFLNADCVVFITFIPLRAVHMVGLSIYTQLNRVLLNKTMSFLISHNMFKSLVLKQIITY